MQPCFRQMLLLCALLATSHSIFAQGFSCPAGQAAQSYNVKKKTLLCIQVPSIQQVANLEARMSAAEGRITNLETRASTAESAAAALQARVSSLEGQLGLVQALSPYLSVELNDLNGVVGPHILISGANLHIRNGTGAQLYENSPVNGLGNLIVGYNEVRETGPVNRGGSHNIVVGFRHNFPSLLGLVAGSGNNIDGIASSITGGTNNVATGMQSTIAGGADNRTLGVNTTLISGFRNTVQGEFATVIGGRENSANGLFSGIFGGRHNTTNGEFSSIHGGTGLSTHATDERLP